MIVTRRLQILILEDNPSDAELLVRELRRSGLEFDWKRVETQEAFTAELRPGLDLILSDYDLPQFTGMEALQIVRQMPNLDVPFIIVSGTIGEETAVKAIKQGADDYLLKDRVTRLGAAVEQALRHRDEVRAKKALEAQLIESQKMEVLGRLAAGVAHDFNNVLVVMLCYSDLIIQDLSADDPIAPYIEEMQVAAQRAVGLTQQLLLFSRKESAEIVPTRLNEVIEGTEKTLRRLVDENVELEMVLGKQIGDVQGNSGYIWQVLMNLVINARDAMPQGGHILIETSRAFLDEAYVQGRPGVAIGEFGKLSVSDTGPGMTDEVKERLFEPFFTTKQSGKGTGLGLATCLSVVKRCGGHIDVACGPGSGTRFDIYFPLSDGSVEAGKPPHTDLGRLPKGAGTILVVEDEPSLRDLARRILQAQGYEVVTASNGQDAIRVVRENQGQLELDLVLTDVVMPLMGGKAMAEELKATYPNIKVLFTSGYTEDAITPHGVFSEDAEFLPKPYTRTKLIQKVRALLGR
jgi:signal transduction histidine kinase